MNKNKKSIFLHITTDLKNEVLKINENNLKDNKPCEYGVFFTLRVDKEGNPIQILKSYVGNMPKNIPVDTNGKTIPFFYLIPFNVLEKKYFKCDNCEITGQTRGYYMVLQTNIPYTFCPVCTEGM